MLTFPRAFVVVLLLATAVSVLGYNGNGSYPSDSSTSFNITNPVSSVVWTVGQTVNISWTNPADVSSQYTALDGYGCNVALFNSSDHSALIYYISLSAVFATGFLSWTVPSDFASSSTYVVGVGFNSYVTGNAEILISMSKPTSLLSTTTQNTQNTQNTQTTQTMPATQSTNEPLTTAHSSSSTQTQQALNATASPAQFSSVGGIGGLVGIVTGVMLVVGGILGIMAYNSCRERKDHFPDPGHGSQYAGEGSSYVPKSDESYSYVNDYDGTKTTHITSPPTSPNLGATNVPPGLASNRSTYTPFSKRNPNPHHDNVDLLQVDPFAKPVPAYILNSDSTERPTDQQQRGGKGRRPSEPEESRPYNFI